jgi:hypothetical protein
MADMRCRHDRLDGSCEDCAYDAAKEAGAPLGGPPPVETREGRADARVHDLSVAFVDEASELGQDPASTARAIQRAAMEKAAPEKPRSIARRRG